jgi:hypothetical protein
MNLSNFNICIVRFPGPIPAFEAYREVAETVKYGLQALGYNAIISDDKLMDNCVNIVFGWQFWQQSDPARYSMLSEPTIFYNLEKIPDLPGIVQSIFSATEARVPIWDYNIENCDLIRQRYWVSNVYYVPIGYMPEMSRISPTAEQDIDVLFYGGVTERRGKILEDLRDAGLKIEVLKNLFGLERDQYIARAKVVLNIHSEQNIHWGSLKDTFEIVRVSYLLANSKAVVSEYSEKSTSIEDDLLDALVLVDYKDLVPACVDLVKNAKKRRFYERKGFSVISARDETIYLKEALSKTFHPSEGDQ